MSIKGLGMGKARLLKLAKSLTIPTYEQTTIRPPKDAFNLIEPNFGFSTKENYTCLFLNTRNKVLHFDNISIGSLKTAIVHPREVFRAAIKHCSASLISAHNHPSGDSTLSPEDCRKSRNATKKYLSLTKCVTTPSNHHYLGKEKSLQTL
ncbi:JAB domain-containing protein [Paenibacillus sp. FSL R7-0652]|uniref:JAB domain-containing protein n=1 Tax=Paenibacillus sp. FSL R7-0652 TaxID=2921687 RepID=UPI00315B3528